MDLYIFVIAEVVFVLHGVETKVLTLIGFKIQTLFGVYVSGHEFSFQICHE